MKIQRQAITLSLAAALACAALPAAARHAEMKEPERAALNAAEGKKPDAKRVQAAIREAARETGWVVRDDSPGKMTLRHTKGKHEAVIDVLYDAAGYQLKYLSSIDLGYRIKDGHAQIHPVYNEWVDSLQRRIEHAFASSGR